MGCTDSTVVAENKSKPVFSIISEPSQHGSCSVLLGEIQQNRFACWNITASDKAEEVLSITQRALPLLIARQNPHKLKLPNFAQMTRVYQTNLYILSGGINFKLDYIYGSSYLYNVKTNKMYPLPQMKQSRYTHSAVFVNGSLVVLGGRYFGEDDQALLNKCEKLSFGISKQSSEADIEQTILQSKLQWQQIDPMKIKRCSHVTVLYNNRIYAIGGYTGEFQRSPTIEYLNLTGNQGWKILPVELPFGIQSSVASVNSQNQITIFGGNSNSGPTATVFTINLLEGCESIHSNQDLTSPKVLHKLYQHQQHMYFLGGNKQMDIEIYNINNSQEKRTQALTKEVKKKKTKVLQKLFESQQKLEALTQASITLQIPYRKPQKMKQEQREKDERAFIFGTSSEPFILQLNISVPYAIQHPVPLSIKVFALQGAIHLKNTQQYILFGGISDSQQEVNAKTYLLNFRDFSASRQVAHMNVSRYAFGYQIIDDWIYAIGGGSCDQEGELIILNKCQRINVTKLKKHEQPICWDHIADLPFGLISPMTLTWNSRLYVFGGMKQNKERFQNILWFNDKNNTWDQLKFTFPFGLEASSIYHKQQNQFLIFGGRVVNGDTNSIWDLTMISNGEDCVFSEKGKMNEAKCLHKVYKPRHQDFYVILGGQKDVLSFYDCSSMKLIQSDVLSGLKEMFSSSLKSLRDKSLKNYSIITSQQ